mgnify:CR=1 FL=1
MRHMLRVFNDIYLLTGQPFCETPTGQVELLQFWVGRESKKITSCRKKESARWKIIFTHITLYMTFRRRNPRNRALNCDFLMLLQDKFDIS